MTFKRFLLGLVVCWVWAIPLYAQDNAYAQALHSYYRGHYEEALAYLSRVPDGTVSAKPVLKSMIYLSTHHPQEARLALQGSSVTGNMGDYVRYVDLLITLEAQDLSKGQAFLDSEWMFTNPFLMRKARLDVAEALYKQGQFKAAAALALQLLTYLPDSVITPKAMRLLLMIDLEIRDHAATLRRYGALICAYPSEDPDLALFQTIQKVLGIHATLADCFQSPDQYMRYIKALFEDKNYVQQINQASKFLAQFPRSPLISQAHFYHGLGMYHLMRYRQAAVSFERAISYDANPRNYPRYYYYAAHSCLMLQDKRAVSYLTILAERYPKNPYIPWSYYWLCRYHEEYGDHRLYAKYYAKFKKNYSHTPQWEQYVWEQQWKALQKTAKTTPKLESLPGFFDSVIDQAVISPKLLAYYRHLGRSLAEGIVQYPIPFQTLAWFKGMYSDDEPYPERLQQLQIRTQHLYAMGLGDLAAQEVRFVSSQDVDIFRGVNLRYLYGTLLAKLRGDLHPDSTLLPEWRMDPVQFVKVQIPKFLLKLFYPKAYWDSVSTYSRLYGVDPYLALAIMREESAFDPFAVSRTTARGLMQLMPKTGRDVTFRLGLRWVGEESLYEPDLNIRLGIYYFSWLRKQFKGPEYFSVAAYNAGPEVAYQWIRKPGSAASLDQFVLSVPYPETQAYIRRVMNSYMIYRMLYADETR